MYFTRNIDKELLRWKIESNRKPLLLRGARQVGKSSAVNQLAHTFKYFITLNFDETPALKTLFEQNLPIPDLCAQIAVFTNTPIQAGETLIFLDEIQGCIPAISSLRYFYEKYPELHVIAAGSLLEFALSEIPSFGVGRVRSLFMYPFSFYEFLEALGKTSLLSLIQLSNSNKPLPELIHQKTVLYFKYFLVIGGMPEAVSTYVQTKDLLKVQHVLDDLIISMQEDFVKYKKRVSKERIKEVFSAVMQQVSSKFTYSYHQATLNHIQIKETLNLLQMAGLIYSVTHTSANGIPLGAEINPKKKKFLVLDTGIYQRLLGLDIAQIMIHLDFNVINKGHIAEMYVGLELIKAQSSYQDYALYYWHRESKNSQAEVDYVIQQQDEIIPIEVKAGLKGSMQSLYLFLQEKKVSYGIRFSLENFSKLPSLHVFPLYAVPHVFRLEPKSKN